MLVHNAVAALKSLRGKMSCGNGALVNCKLPNWTSEVKLLPPTHSAWLVLGN